MYIFCNTIFNVLCKIKYIIGIFCLSVSLAAQNSIPEESVWFQFQPQYGFLLPHHKSIRYYIDSHVPAFEINVSYNTAGRFPYDDKYRFPKVGLAYFAGRLDKQGFLGYAHALYPFIRIPVYSSTCLTIHYRIAIGYSRLTKPFDLYSNFYNHAIGSHGNLLFGFLVDALSPLNKKVELITSAGLTHFSNGNIRQPNLGINYISALLGLRYKLHSTTIFNKVTLEPFINRKYEFQSIISAGARVLDLEFNEPLFASSLSFDMGRYLSDKRKIGLGIDFFYSEVLGLILTQEGKSANSFEKTQTGFHISHDLVYNRFIMSVQMGTYVLAKYKSNAVYGRFALRYRISKNVLASVAIKTHLAIADFVEWGIGYSFSNKKNYKPPRWRK